jgi:hypothetical protein
VDDSLNVNTKASLLMPCRDDGQILGIRRDCEWESAGVSVCVPGHLVRLQCWHRSAAWQVLRHCEASRVWNLGMACRFRDGMLSNVLVPPSTNVTVTFVCPLARDTTETGGYISAYSGALLNGLEDLSTIVCEPHSS